MQLWFATYYYYNYAIIVNVITIIAIIMQSYLMFTQVSHMKTIQIRFSLHMLSPKPYCIRT